MMEPMTGAKDVVADLRELASLTSDEQGAHRVAWTPVWDKAEKWFMEKMKAEGAEISIDSAHNVFAKIQGESDDAVLIGSHLDCVYDGGWLDGALGVVAGMGALKRYGIHGKKPKKTLYVVSWADEEGARFGRSCIGSSAVSGSLPLEEAAALKDNDGISFTEALKRYQLDIHDFPKAREEFMKKNITSYLELHIEQAPVLESMNKSVACVSGICGCERQYITFTGQRAHSGCPISMRHDAFWRRRRHRWPSGILASNTRRKISSHTALSEKSVLFPMWLLFPRRLHDFPGSTPCRRRRVEENIRRSP